MNPVSPVLDTTYQSQEKVYARDQPQYRQLPVLKSANGVLLSRWRLTDDERRAIAEGADVFLFNWTFNQPLQPVRLEVGELDRTDVERAAFLGLLTPSGSLKAIDAILAEPEADLSKGDFKKVDIDQPFESLKVIADISDGR